MNQQATKKPRTDAKILPSPKKKQKKSKSSKSSKQNPSHGTDKQDTTTGANSLELTATAEGITMTQVLSTFNRVEQSRFEAFRRCTFRGDAISDYVAHCLESNDQRAYIRNNKMPQYLGVADAETSREAHCPYVKKSSNGISISKTTDTHVATATADTTTANSSSKKKRSLQDMVPPGQAEEITVVVSTLAKSYAQRLVAAAKKIAAAEGADESTPLTPQQVLKAHHSRVQAGLDPGFFLQKPKATAVAESSASMAAALGIDDVYASQRSAALAAQEEYDNYLQEKKKNAMDVDEASPTNESKEDTDVSKEGDKMEVDNDEKKMSEADDHAHGDTKEKNAE